jgi:hypothetical protein
LSIAHIFSAGNARAILAAPTFDDFWMICATLVYGQFTVTGLNHAVGAKQPGLQRGCRGKRL